MRRFFLLSLLLLIGTSAFGQEILIPMDVRQTDHLKAYGIVYWGLTQGQQADWLLNYRGGSFLTPSTSQMEEELRIRGVYYEKLSGSQVAAAVAQIESESSNTSIIRLEKAPKIAVYAPKQTLPWDDAVLLALEYSEIPYEMIYDDDVLEGKLSEYDWLHLHHEDFTGQYGKFWAMYRNTSWYIEQQRQAEAAARRHGFRKVSQLKLAVAQAIKGYVFQGGFLFAMCSGTDTIDLALAAGGTDIVDAPYDGDAVDPDAVNKLDFSQSFAFQNFTPEFSPQVYEHSDIDVRPPPMLANPTTDFFTLFEFSAKWDPVPTMLTQNHVASVRGFMGQTTMFRKGFIKPNVVIMAESPGRDAVRYLHSTLGQGTFTFYGGHDPEDYQHYVSDPPTDLNLHKNSPGYRLILNNILFPAARKKKQKT